MNVGILILVAVIVIILVFVIWLAEYIITDRGKKRVVVASDKLDYEVVDLKQDDEKAAEMLVKINKNVIKLIDHLNKKYVQHSTVVSEPYDERKEQIVKSITKRYNPDNLVETDPRSGETSFTIDKGWLNSICLRERDAGADKFYDFEDFDLIMFVVLHEVAHLGVEPYDHPMEFWECFKFLLREATEIGIYSPVNYKTSPVMYCGMKVTNNPLFESVVKDI